MMQIESLGQTETVPPPAGGYVPKGWVEWIRQVTPLIPDLPPPHDVPVYLPEGGPRPEWVEWLRAAAARVPHIPPPEEIPKKRSILLYVAMILALLYVAKNL